MAYNNWSLVGVNKEDRHKDRDKYKDLRDAERDVRLMRWICKETNVEPFLGQLF